MFRNIFPGFSPAMPYVPRIICYLRSTEMKDHGEKINTNYIKVSMT